MMNEVQAKVATTVLLLRDGGNDEGISNIDLMIVLPRVSNA